MTVASASIGGGHVLRCLALAKSLAVLGVHVRFATDRVTRDTVRLLGTSGFAGVETAPASAHEHAQLSDTDIVIFDGYGIDIAIEARWRGIASLSVAIDDLANRPHDCDVLLDHHPGRERTHYDGLVPADCTVLAGPDYALVRPEFRTLRPIALARRHVGPPRRLLIAMGLTDVGGVSRRAVEGVQASQLPLAIDVVTGRTAVSLPWLEDQARAGVLRLHVDLEARGMAELMAEADVAVGSGGGTSLERCCLGLPSFVVMVADNQRSGIASLVRLGATTSLGVFDESTPRRIATALAAVDGRALAAQARAAAGVVDGEGADRVGRVVLDRLAAAR